MALPDRISRPRRGPRGRWRLRRQLAGITKSLAKDATLAAKFAMFNALNKGEPPSGAEPLPQFRWRLPPFGWPLTLLVARTAGQERAGQETGRLAGPRRRHRGDGRRQSLGTLLLSSLLRPAARTCLMLASSGTQASASAAPSKAGERPPPQCPASPSAASPGDPVDLSAYPAKK